MSLLTSLISYWKMDEASGNALDANGANTLTDHAGVGTGTGIINGARMFTASSFQYLSHTSNSDLQVGNLDFTITTWVRFSSLGASSQQVVTKYSNASNEYAILYQNPNQLAFYSGAGFSNVISSTSVSTGTWYFVVVWFDSSNQSLNISINDGTTSSTVGIASPPPTGAAEFQIGNRDGQAEYLDGLIDETGFWKRVLTSGERTSLYDSGSGLPYSSFGGGIVAAQTGVLPMLGF